MMSNERLNEILEVRMDAIKHGLQTYRLALDKIARMKGKASTYAVAAILEAAEYSQKQAELHHITEEEMDLLEDIANDTGPGIAHH